jgi:hypothetical protein
VTTYYAKKITAGKSREVKPGRNQAESSKKGYGSKRAVLPVMMMIIFIIGGNRLFRLEEFIL